MMRLKVQIIRGLLLLVGGLITECVAQVAYDPYCIVGWNSMSQYPGYIMAPYDIVLDHVNAFHLPARFRTPYLTLASSASSSLEGFASLKISGSGQFSENQFLTMTQFLKSHYLVKPENLLVIDLREESHGFINGDAVTFYYGPLSFKRNQPAAILLQDDARKLDFVRSMPSVFIYKILKGEDGMPFNKVPYLQTVTAVASEQNVVEKAGAHYLRLPVTDHFRPSNKAVDAFIEKVETLSPDTWIHVKCRGGKGRTTTFMIMYDMLKNPHLPKEVFFKRQVLIQGINLSKATKVEKKEWKWALGEERVWFLHRFYEYLQAADGYKVQSWSAWVRIHFPGTEDETFQFFPE